MALGEDWSNGLARERSLRGAAHASLRDSQTLDRNTDAETAAVELEIAQLQASQADAGTAATVDASAAAAATDYMYAGGTGDALARGAGRIDKCSLVRVGTGERAYVLDAHFRQLPPRTHAHIKQHILQVADQRDILQ